MLSICTSKSSPSKFCHVKKSNNVKSGKKKVKVCQRMVKSQGMSKNGEKSRYVKEW